METRLLRTFIAVAETGSISSAAIRLDYAQSSVSEHIRRLERELQTTLLTRTSTGVTLTPAGRRLVPAAGRALVAVEELGRAAQDAPRLRIGSVDTLAVHWLPRLMPPTPVDQHPAITMDRRDLLLRGLLEGRLDVVFLFRTRGAALPQLGGREAGAVDGFEVEVLDTDELVVVTAPESRAADDGWLVTQPGCVHREAFDQHVAPHLRTLRVRAEAPTPDALRQLARQGAGRALLPSLAVAEDLADGRLVVDRQAPVGGVVEIVAVHRADAGAATHDYVRRLRARSRRPGDGSDAPRR